MREKRRETRAFPLFLAASLLFLLAAGEVPASGNGPRLHAALSGFQEVPALVSPGSAFFGADFDLEAMTASWRLVFADLDTPVTDIHIHIGQPDVLGAIVVFLCSNSASAPAGTPACPASPATLSGTITAADVLGAEAQGIGPGEIAKFLMAMRAGALYINVHTEAHPNGELRGQIRVLPRQFKPLVLH